MSVVSNLLSNSFQKIGNSLGIITRDIAIDLGTANTLVYEKG